MEGLPYVIAWSTSYCSKGYDVQQGLLHSPQGVAARVMTCRKGYNMQQGLQHISAWTQSHFDHILPSFCPFWVNQGLFLSG
jgi:hypothetical protein